MIIRLWGIKSLRTISWLSKKHLSIHLIVDLPILAWILKRLKYGTLSLGFWVVLKHTRLVTSHVPENGDHFQSIPKNLGTFLSWCPFGATEGFWNNFCGIVSHTGFIGQNLMNDGVQLFPDLFDRRPTQDPEFRRHFHRFLKMKVFNYIVHLQSNPFFLKMF